MNMLSKFAGLRKIAGRVPFPVVALWLISITVIALVTGLVATHLADSKGYDRGLAAGTTQGYASGLADGQAKGFADGEAKGFTDGQATGFAGGRASGFADGEAKGFTDGQAKYTAGYNAAMNDAVQVIKTYLPPLLQATYANGRASAPIYVPSFDFGSTSIHCTATAYGVSTSVNCY